MASWDKDIMASSDEDIMESWDEELLTAAAEGNIKEVEICIKNRANLECRDSLGMTPLMWAARGGHLEVVTFLVTHGSQLEVTSKVKRIRKGHCVINEEYMDLIPTDEILDKLAQVIGVVSFQLGLELGLPITSIDIIQYNNGRDLVAQCKDILFQWREDQRVRPTIRVLVQALVNVDRGAKCLEEIIKTVGVKKYTLHEEVEEKKEGKIKTLLKNLNPFQKKK